MPVLELPISDTYVDDWGVWEGIRELAQNAKDAHEAGFPMSLTYDTAKKTLTFFNKGARMSRDMLLLGASGKRGDDRMIGQFGEGFKLAWLALLRKNKTITCDAGEESWTPTLGNSAVFNARLLKVRTRKVSYHGGVTCTVAPIHPDDWEVLKSRLLFLQPPSKDSQITVTAGRILTDEKEANKLYVKGILVGELPDDYTYGYDLVNVRLDRDRRLSDPWSLRTAIRTVLTDAVLQDSLSPETVFAMLSKTCGEALAFQNAWMIDAQLSQKLAGLFSQKNGENAIPVKGIGDSAEASACGLKGVVVSEAVMRAIQDTTGTLETRRTTSASSIKTQYSWDDLNAYEKATLRWAVMLVSKVHPALNLDRMQVVDFVGDKILGMHSLTGTISVARHVLMDRAETLATVVHEFTHDFDATHSVAFQSIAEKTFADIIVRMNQAGDA